MCLIHWLCNKTCNFLLQKNRIMCEYVLVLKTYITNDAVFYCVLHMHSNDLI